MKSISVLDLGISNIASVLRMIEKLGAKAEVVSKPEEIISAKKLILPGVGSYDAGMEQIYSRGLFKNLKIIIHRKKIPVLGICLGMQLFCRNSEEGNQPGLGLVAADVKKFRWSKDQSLKIPHMGWNTLNLKKQNPLIPYSEMELRFYFVHSYFVKPDNPNIIISTTDYGIRFCSAFQYKNLLGVQFHPEKSHKFGLRLFENFINL